jgi:hypothetical protein
MKSHLHPQIPRTCEIIQGRLCYCQPFQGLVPLTTRIAPPGQFVDTPNYMRIKSEGQAMSEQQLRKELVEAFKNRAILYWLIFDELRGEVGEAKAAAIMKRAVYRRGEQIGRQKYSQFAPSDFEGLKKAFVSGIPDEGRLFEPNVVRCDGEGLDIHLEHCPLKGAWEELGLSPRDKVLMCEIAGVIDKGTFEAAGFAFEPNTWRPGRTGCCHLEIRPASKSS